ncbi:MAG: DEAD/DEAH box helicase [Thermodesulfobacteriota bacterium]|nr:DEAD/DEAH box helicase [Thermodesulfobacteriota bacterium]
MPRPGRPRRGKESALYGNPRVTPGLKPVFRQIGVPDPQPFTPDRFQQEALDLINDFDVLVSAPTGAGKTWVASQAIHMYLERGSRIWYASPLKALSNSIFQEFSSEFGSDICGILTGDRKENPDAPIIVGTTEILRNQLYDAMHEGVNVRADLVVLDEAHYLSDPDRGVVWEETLIYLPARVRLLLLSATISNAEEICAWLETIRKVPNRVVMAHDRPVPLEMLFLFQDGRVVPLAGKKGLSSEVRKFLGSQEGRRRGGRGKVDFGKIIACLRELDLLPIIFFLKSRADCNRALLTCPSIKGGSRRKDLLRQTARAFLKDFPHLENHRQMKPLLESRVASHHGGQLPYWKVLIEKMMNKGYLEAIFSTSTVAAGVNFPARTVALMQSDRFNGHDFVDLTAGEYHQMVGRAGRRGKDRIGFGLVVPGIHMDPRLINRLLGSSPEPVTSRIQVNFSMTLNLLLSHRPEEIKDLFERSFATFQWRSSGEALEQSYRRIISELKDMLKGGKCDIEDPYEVQEYIQKRADLTRQIRSLSKTSRHARLKEAWKEYLKPGRLFLHRNKNIYMVFQTRVEQGRFICDAFIIKRRGATRKRPLKIKRVDLNQVRGILDYHVDLPRDCPKSRLQGLLDSIPSQEPVMLNIDLSEQKKDTQELNDAEQDIKRLPCTDCRHHKTCHGKNKGPLRNRLAKFRSLASQREGMDGGLWLSFKRHLRFLKETGFVDDKEHLTVDGIWASKLRLDQPLVIAEAIRKGAFAGCSPEMLSAGLAPFVWDRTQDVELNRERCGDLNPVETIFDRLLEHTEEISSLKKRRGFVAPPIMFWPAAALFMWAKGVPWEPLLAVVSVDEGDLASLIMRTADHLRQVANLHDTHPRLAATARDAIDLVLREPVYLP